MLRELSCNLLAVRHGFAAPIVLMTVLTGLLGAAAPAGARPSFQPRIGTAMGLFPAAGSRDVATGSSYPLLYHGGSVMHAPVTVHTLFWAPPGFRFGGAPGAGVLGYEPMIQRFFTGLAHDSGATGNFLSLLRQYPDAAAPNRSGISYNAATDSIDDTHPFPARSAQCPSPAGIATCLTDQAVGRELDQVISARDPRARGLHDVWMVFLPPGVDECLNLGSCGTSAFGAYHTLSNLGRGPVIYAVMVDPLIEAVAPAGRDPRGNPDAEEAINAAAHELVEAITDPEGAGWLDPNGFEVADKCENPEFGTPLGFAPNGSPFNQVVGGDQYLIQDMWSNAASGCEQRSTATSSAPALASVSLHQFSPNLSGNVGTGRAAIPVLLGLERAGHLVAVARTRTRTGGAWGPVTLRSISTGQPHAVGDDRDVLIVEYGRGGPKPDLIATGSGGNPFGEAGWTGFTDLDTGYRVRARSVAVSPCSQTGVLELSLGGAAVGSPTTLCGQETDVARVPTRRLGGAASLTLSSEDNRAPSLMNRGGALVSLTVALGEPGGVAATGNRHVLLRPSGFPSCTADLRTEVLRCSGLVPRALYTVTRRRGHGRRSASADRAGTIRIGDLPGPRPIARGDVLTLRNRARRVLSALHVADLRVAIDGSRTVLSAGSCQPGDYYGRPLATQPIGSAVGIGGAAGTGRVCPASGRAAGLPDGLIEQTDDFSGGLTRTEVPQLAGTAPANDAIVYGAFTALAQSGLTGAHGGAYGGGAPISLRIARPGTRQPAFRARNVDTPRGVSVPALSRGVYQATWVLSDANGDTRTVRTRFVEAK